MVRAGDTMIIGGDFSWMKAPDGAVARRYGLAAISLTTGDLLPWAPAVSGTVRLSGAVAERRRRLRRRVVLEHRAAPPGPTSRGSAWPRARCRRGAPTPTARSGTWPCTTVICTRWGRSPRSVASGGAGARPSTPRRPPSVPGTPVPTPGSAPSRFGPTGQTAYLGGAFTTLGGEAREFVGAVSADTGDVTSWRAPQLVQRRQQPVLRLRRRGHRHPRVPRRRRARRPGHGPRPEQRLRTVVDGRRRRRPGAEAQRPQAVRRWALLRLLRRLPTAPGSPSSTPRAGPCCPTSPPPSSAGPGVWTMSLDESRFGIGGHFETVNGVTTRRYAAFAVLPDPADTSPPTAPTIGAGPRDPVGRDRDEVVRGRGQRRHLALRRARDGVEIGESNKPFFRDRTVLPGTEYRYTVRAVDTSDNIGPASSAETVTTESARALFIGSSTPVRFWSTGNLPSGAWTTTGYNDGGWSVGAGEHGYGDGDEDTFISPLGVAHYFRTAFTIPDLAAVSNPRLRLLLDDGAVAYLNGSELARENVHLRDGHELDAGADLQRQRQRRDGLVDVPDPGRPARAGRQRPGGRGAQLLVLVVRHQLRRPDRVHGAGRAGHAHRARRHGESSSSVGLSWNPSAGATSYLVQRGTTTIATVASTSYVDTGLSADTTYSYRVIAANSNGSSAPSCVGVGDDAGRPGPAAGARCAAAVGRQLDERPAGLDRCHRRHRVRGAPRRAGRRDDVEHVLPRHRAVARDVVQLPPRRHERVGLQPARSRGLGHDPGGTGRPAAGARRAWRPRA